MKHNAPQHAKFRRLVRLIRDRVTLSSITVETVCVGILERLWHATILSAPRGNIGKLENVDIAESVGWFGDADELIECLIKSGWLDECREHRLIVHDWHDHCPTFIKGNLAKHGRDFVSDKKTKPNLTKPNLTSKQRAKQPAKQKYTSDFEDFWRAFPSIRKTDKRKAFEAWQKALKQKEAATLIAAAKEYAGSNVAKGKFCKGPQSWLNGGCWDDDRVAWSRTDDDEQTSAYKDLTQEAIE